MINMYQHSFGCPNVVMHYSQIGLDHLINAVLEWRPPILVLNGDQVVLCALDVEHEVHRLLRSASSKLKDFLFRDRDGIGVVQAAKVDVLHRVILRVDLVENLPSDIELDPLPDELHVVTVVSLRDRFLTKLYLRTYLLVEIGLGLLHLSIKDEVVFVSNSLISFLLLLIRNTH